MKTSEDRTFSKRTVVVLMCTIAFFSFLGLSFLDGCLWRRKTVGKVSDDMAEMTRAEVREVLGPPDLSEKIPGRLRDKEALGYWHLYPWDHVLVWILGENFRTKTMGLIVIFEGEEVLKVLYCPPYSSWSRVLVAEEKPRRNYLQPGK